MLASSDLITALPSHSAYMTFSVILIGVLIAGLAFFLIVLSVQLTRIADNLDVALERVDAINANAAPIVPGLEHINRTGGVVASALPLLYGFAERIIKGVSPVPHRDHVARPAMGSRRSRLCESVGYTPDGGSANGHGHGH